MMWLVLLLLVALSLMASLGLFLSLKRDLRMREREERQRMETLVQRLREAAPPPRLCLEPAPEPVFFPLRSGMNLNWRSQALRLLRQGENAGHVAAALAVPRSEVDLLIRVQELAAARISATTVDSAPASG